MATCMENCEMSTYQSTGLEKSITVFRGSDSLGMTVKALKDGSGLTIHSVVNGGAVRKDGRLKVGDGITAINGEPTTNLTSAQARAMLRRHSIVGPDLKLTYVPSAFLDMHQAIQSKQKINSGQTSAIHSNQKSKMDRVTADQSKKGEHPAFIKSEPISESTNVDGERESKNTSKQQEEDQVQGTRSEDNGKRTKKEAANMSMQRSDLVSCSQIRRVTLVRTNGKSFGISVIGGRGLGSRLSNGEMRRGIFIKHIAENSPAALNKTLTPGDRILQVGDVNLSEFTHEEAVQVIRQAGNKVELLVQNPQTDQTSITPSASDSPPKYKHGATWDQEGISWSQEKPQRCSSKKGSTNPPTPFITSLNPIPPRASAPVRLNTPAIHCVLQTVHSASTTKSTHYIQPLCNHYAAELPKTSYCSSCSYKTSPLSCPIFPGCINTIDICKEHTVLGLTIVGGCNTTLEAILIHEVNEGGAAQKDGRLMAGDHILEVNDIDLRTATHEEALSVLRLSPHHVRLCVYRPISTHTHDMWDLFTVELPLRPGFELGLSIVGKRNGTGIFVSEVKQRGIAELDGRLMLGDQILSVNGEDIRAASQDYASTLLKNCHGPVVLEVARFRAFQTHPVC